MFGLEISFELGWWGGSTVPIAAGMALDGSTSPVRSLLLADPRSSARLRLKRPLRDVLSAATSMLPAWVPLLLPSLPAAALCATHFLRPALMLIRRTEGVEKSCNMRPTALSAMRSIDRQSRYIYRDELKTLL